MEEGEFLEQLFVVSYSKKIKKNNHNEEEEVFAFLTFLVGHALEKKKFFS